MPRKKNAENQTETTTETASPKMTGIQETELAFLESLGPGFASGVAKVRKLGEGVTAAKATVKAAKKEQRTVFVAIRKAARKLAEAGF